MSTILSTARAIILVATVLAIACSGASSPVDPGTPDPSPPGPNPPTLGPSLTVSTSAVSLGAVAAQASIMLRNPGSSPVTWTYEASAGWMTASPAAGTLPGGGTATVRIAVDRHDLEPGVHSGRARFLVGDEGPEVDVTVEVPAPALPTAEVSPASLALTVEDVSGAVYVTNAGGAPLTWSWQGPSWASVEPAAATTAPGSTTTVVITPNRTSLSDGTHSSTLTFDSNGGQRSVALSVAVASPARLSVSPLQVDFGSTGTSSAVTIANGGGRPLVWSAGESAAWLSATPTSGTLAPHSNATIQLFADRGASTAGSYVETLSIESGAGPAAVEVVMTVPAPDPTSPPPPSPPPPSPPPPSPPPPSGSVALAGRVVDQFGGNGVAGVTVRFAGQTVTTDGSGAFSVPGDPSGSLRDLALSGPHVHSRVTFARGQDTQWRIVPESFDMASFNDVAREYEPRTIRWMQSPSIYIDTRPEGFAGGLELERWISEVRSDAPAFVSDWTGGMVDPGSVTVGNSPPPEGTPGTIVIRFSENDQRYSGPNTVGMARTFWSGDRSISSAAIWLRFERYSGPSQTNLRRAVLGHELGHAIGMGHMNGSTPSIMTPSVSSPSLTGFDGDAGLLLYTRSPGNTSPDVDSQATYRGSLTPSMAVGSYNWVCGAEEEP
ncbi:MAG TPA: hypothetical protein VJ788_02725 [Gemmatimonadota bacterium]|nr:hypothetical protein [Gemmatimonadota bacterium]